MGSEWREGRLGDFIELHRGYDLPQQDRRPGPVPLVSSSGISDHLAAAMIDGPGVVTGRYGTIGQVFYLDEPFWPLNTTLYVSDFKGNDPLFASYLLRTVDFMAFSDKAAVPGVNRNHVHEAIIRWPVSIVEQKRIAGILGALDDKIDLNRRMSQTLESMARALFRSWFVDFDPVRAKAEGRDPSLTSAFADLFPDSLIDSELGEIPYGWGVAPLGDLVELAYGKALRSQDRRPGFVPVYGSNGQVGWHDEALALGPGVVVGRKGTPGTVEWSARDFYVIDTAFYVVRKCPALTLPFLFHALQCQDLAALGADSAVPGLNRNLAYMSSQIVPPRPLVEAFGELALSLSRRGDACDREAASLESTREALIPWLLNSSSIGAATAMPRTGGTT